MVQLVAGRTVHGSRVAHRVGVAGFCRYRDGRLEEKAGAGALVADAAVPRWGTPEEMAELFAFCASDRAGYLTGTDILNDGGVVASMRERARVAAEQQQQ